MKSTWLIYLSRQLHYQDNTNESPRVHTKVITRAVARVAVILRLTAILFRAGLKTLAFAFAFLCVLIISQLQPLRSRLLAQLRPNTSCLVILNRIQLDKDASFRYPAKSGSCSNSLGKTADSVTCRSLRVFEVCHLPGRVDRAPA
jgi:hypothetical protein